MYGIMIQALRKREKLRQAELGEKLGIGVSSISMWEAEKRAPSIENFMALAELFGVSVDYILFGKSEGRELSKDESEMLDLYSSLSDTQKSEIKGIIKGILMADSGK